MSRWPVGWSGARQQPNEGGERRLQLEGKTVVELERGRAGAVSHAPQQGKVAGDSATVEVGTAAQGAEVKVALGRVGEVS